MYVDDDLLDQAIRNAYNNMNYYGRLTEKYPDNMAAYNLMIREQQRFVTLCRLQKGEPL